jgi:hypothetical protein
LPDALALGAAIGNPAARNSFCATGCDGMRTASVSSPALASNETDVSLRRGSTSVSGPGHKVEASNRAMSFNSTRGARAAVSATWMIRGLKLGLPLTA